MTEVKHAAKIRTGTLLGFWFLATSDEGCNEEADAINGTLRFLLFECYVTSC